MTKINNKTAKISLQAKEIENGILIVKICGSENSMCELDMQTITSFEYESDKLLSQCKLKLIIDMSKVQYMDSEGLFAIFDFHKKVKSKRGNVVIIDPMLKVKKTFEITKMSDQIKIMDNEKEAIIFLKTIGVFR
tara:strand:- start:2595 stop:2999 length:405 start_codon:yes stop_codon:yes gene_type:complete